MIWLRRLLKSLGAVVALLLVALVAVYGALRTGLLTPHLDAIITALAKKKDVFFVTAEGVSGDVPGHLRVKKVEVGDGFGVYLTIEDAEATWSPFDLFHPFDPVKWRINVHDITAKHVRWTRLPHDRIPDDEPFRWDHFVRILVGHIRVDDFELTGDILGGQTAHLEAEGHGVLGEWDHGSVVLDLAHVDGRAGKARIDLATKGSPLELSGTVTAEEDAGGALAALARLKDAGAVRLDLRASGAMKDWHGEADVVAANIGTLHAKTHLAFTAAGPFQVTGSFDPVPAQREKYLVGAGAPLVVEAEGAWAPDVELRIDRARLNADGRDLVAHGRLDLATKEFVVDGTLVHLEQGTKVVTTLLEAAKARIEGKGVLGDAGHLEATLDVDDASRGEVSSRSVHAALRAKDVPGPSVPTFDLEATAKGLALGDITLPLFGEEATMKASGRIDLVEGLLAADALQLQGGDLAVNGSFGFRDDWHTMTGSLHADAKTLASLTRLARTSVSGSANANLDFETRNDWKNLDVVVSGDASDVAIGEEGWNALIGPVVTLRASVLGATAGPAHAEATLESAGIAVHANGDIGGGGKDLVAEARLSLDNLSRLREPARAEISGRLDASATARGSLDDFDVDATLNADRFAWSGLHFDTLAADLRAEGLPDVWQGSLRSRGRYGKLDAALETKLAMPTSQSLVVRDLVLTGPRSNASASLEIDLARKVASGEVRLEAADLGLWRPMTGLPIGGAVSLDARLASRADGRDGATQLVSGSASIKDGAFSPDGEELFVDALEASADGLEIGVAPRGTARVHASRLRYGDATLVDGVANAKGDGRQWNVDLTADLHERQEMDFVASGSVLPGTSPVVALTSLTGKVGATPVELSSPLRWMLANRDATQWSLPSFALKVGSDGQLSGSASKTAASMHVEAQATKLPLSLVSLASDSLDLTGRIGGSLVLDGASLLTSSGSVSLRGEDVASSGLEEQGVEPVDVEADAKLQRGRLTGTARVAGLHETRLELRIDAPLASSAPGSNVVVDLLWKGDLAGAAALLPLGEDQLAGRVDADLRITGTVAAPRVAGRATVEHARWEHAASGLVLKDIQAEIVGNGTSLELRSLTATDGDKGKVHASGQVEFAGFPGFDARLDLEATDAMLARLDLVTARADTKLAIVASRGADEDATVAGSITGNVRIADARVEIPQRFVADVPELDVVEVGAEVKQAAGLRPKHGPAALALDIAIVADNRIFLSGRGLESEWSSDVHLRGDTADPRVEGVVKSVRGQLSLLGKRFDVTSGTVRFSGEKGNVPYLNLTATAEANDITAIADVTGPALRPTIELRSEPALPRDEVLSRVLFGQSAANLTPLQSVQLAQSIAELAGSPLGGGGGLISGIGRTLGFDRLGIESSGSSGAAALTASKYLTDNVYLRVQQGLTPETSKLAIEWRVLKHITIESDVSQDAQGEVGATWRWDY